MKLAHHYAIQVWWPLPIKIMGLVIQEILHEIFHSIWYS